MRTLTKMNLYLSGWNVFRFVAYVGWLDFNTRTKIIPSAWKIPAVREVGYAWIKGLRLFFGYRLLMTLIFVYRDEDE